MSSFSSSSYNALQASSSSLFSIPQRLAALETSPQSTSASATSVGANHSSLGAMRHKLESLAAAASASDFSSFSASNDAGISGNSLTLATHLPSRERDQALGGGSVGDRLSSLRDTSQPPPAPPASPAPMAASSSSKSVGGAGRQQHNHQSSGGGFQAIYQRQNQMHQRAYSSTATALSSVPFFSSLPSTLPAFPQSSSSSSSSSSSPSPSPSPSASSQPQHKHPPLHKQTEAELCVSICAMLREPNKLLVAAIVAAIGRAPAIAMLHQTRAIERSGGLMRTDGSAQRRRPGGVFLHLVREHMPAERWSAILESERARRRRERSERRRRTAQMLESVTNDLEHALWLPAGADDDDDDDSDADDVALEAELMDGSESRTAAPVSSSSTFVPPRSVLRSAAHQFAAPHPRVTETIATGNQSALLHAQTSAAAEATFSPSLNSGDSTAIFGTGAASSFSSMPPSCGAGASGAFHSMIAGLAPPQASDVADPGSRSAVANSEATDIDMDAK